jgi:hypothetical protein
MIHFVGAHEGVRDYVYAGALTSVPLWLPYITEIGTPLLGFVCVLTGAALGVRRLWRDLFKGKHDD